MDDDVRIAAADHTQLPSNRLALLCRLSQVFNSSLDLDQVLRRVMDEVVAAVHAECGFVMLQDRDRGLIFRVARGLDQATIGAPEFEISRGVAEQVARDGRPVLTSDAQHDERFSMRQSVLNLQLRSILCVPLRTRDSVSGVIYVDNRLQAGVFTKDDLTLLNAIASSAAIAIENARLYEVAVDKGRLERELQVAQAIQAGLLPHQVPRLPGWDFAARWQPAREVAGDFYDFIELDGGKLGLVIGDVSDKGVPAALFMAVTRSIIRASVAQGPSPAEAIAQANRLICADSTGGMFVTLFLAVLDPTTGELTYVNAGHNPPLLYRAGEQEPVELGRTGMALGVLEDAPYNHTALSLRAGDMVLLYTDGVPDAMDPHGESFGLDRLKDVVRQQRGAQAGDVTAELDSAIRAFTGDYAPFDDIAIVVALCLGCSARS